MFLVQVTMSDKEAAERACKDPNPIIDGRKANVNLAYIGAKPRGNATAGECKAICSLPNGKWFNFKRWGKKSVKKCSQVIIHYLRVHFRHGFPLFVEI